MQTLFYIHQCLKKSIFVFKQIYKFTICFLPSECSELPCGGPPTIPTPFFLLPFPLLPLCTDSSFEACVCTLNSELLKGGILIVVEAAELGADLLPLPLPILPPPPPEVLILIVGGDFILGGTMR